VPNRPVNERSRRTRIFLISEPAIYRAGLRRLLELEPDFKVIGAAANWTIALERVPRRRPDVTVVDLGLMVLPDRETLRRFCALSGAARVLVLAPHVAQAAAPEILRRGVRGIVTHETPPALFAKSIRTVASGQYWVGEKALDDVVETLAPAPAHSGDPGGGAGIRLTRRVVRSSYVLSSRSRSSDSSRSARPPRTRSPSTGSSRTRTIAASRPARSRPPIPTAAPRNSVR
jgi:DNA-binding NarL/FixJ family response regulator